ncbi:MAG: cytochrome c maturation protein CcmE, partial [Actinobacteria bacterium]|nr:cytochrome c maturation protein CcmE [Actinomycetota bacterium]
MDLSPREVIPTAPRGRKKPWFAYAVLALVLVAGGVVVAKFLSSALDYYCNVDEIGVKDGCDEGRNIRIQGTVEQG